MQGIRGTRQSGQSRGTVGVTPTGIEIGIDIGIGQLGISTDYGGGIVIGIGGQKIVWGREGGIIRYNVGGFEVFVEARDCVVVETKKIAGITVACRTYPDPGCKLPEPEPPAPNVPIPIPAPDTPLQIPNTEDLMWVVCDLTEESWTSTNGNLRLTSTVLSTRAVLNEEKPTSMSRAPFEVREISLGNSNSIHRITKNKTSRFRLESTRLSNRDSASVTCVVSDAFSNNNGQNWNSTLVGDADYGRSLAFQGTGREIKKYLEYTNRHKSEGLAEMARITGTIFESGWAAFRAGTFKTYSSPRIIPFLPKQNKGILPLAGNQPPMPDKCCKALKADIEDIKKVLACEEILKKKVVIPGELLEIQTDGKPLPKPEIILNYGQMAHAILLAVNRYGIDAPIKVEIEDTDTTKKGNQSDEFTYNSGAVALQAILELLWEIKGDSASRLKIQVRMAYTITRILKTVAGVGESLRTVFKMLGLPFRYDKKKLPLEFNLAAAKRGKGFGQNNGRKGTSSTETELEDLLPGLLEETEYDLPVPFFDANDEDIRELLVKIYIAIQSLPNK